jgi:hypothetical protein
MKRLPRIFRLADVIRTFRYDLTRGRTVLVHPGRVTLGRRYAVLVAFQPDGISESLIQTCTHLVRESFSVVLVSNARLSESDCFQLRKLCHVVIERPNIGHDFGAYKEGIHYLVPYLAGAERLLLLNDSIVYPVVQPDTLIPTLEKLDVDAASAAYVREARKYRPRYRERLPTLASFFLYFRERAINSPAFLAFWQQHLLTGSKPAVVRFGEHGLTATLRLAGISMGAIGSKHALRERLSELSTMTLLDLYGERCLSEEYELWLTEPNELGVTTSTLAERDAELRGVIDRYIDEASVIQTSGHVCCVYLSMNLLKKQDRPSLIFLSKEGAASPSQ